MKGRKPKVSNMVIQNTGSGSLVVKAPDWLPDGAKAEFDAIVKALEATHNFHSAFISSLVTMATALHDRRIARKYLEIEGHVVMHENGPKTNPWVKICRDADMLVLRIAAECGLTPVSMAKVLGVDRKNKVDVMVSDGEEDDLYYPKE